MLPACDVLWISSDEKLRSNLPGRSSFVSHDLFFSCCFWKPSPCLWIAVFLLHVWVWISLHGGCSWYIMFSNKCERFHALLKHFSFPSNLPQSHSRNTNVFNGVPRFQVALFSSLFFIISLPCSFLSNIRFRVSQNYLKLAMQLRLILNFWFSCLQLPRTMINRP